MQFGEWISVKPYKDRNIIIEATGRNLNIAFKDEKYSILKCTLDVTDLKERHYYRFDALLETHELKHRFFYICYDSEDMETHKGHLCSGQKILIPEGCKKVVLELLLFSHKPGTAVLQGVTLTEESPYVPRKVRLCIVS